MIAMYSAEVLKAAMQKSSTVPASASPVLAARGNAPPSSTLLVKKAGAGNTLTPLGPLGLSLRDDDEASSTSVRPRRQQAASEAGYTSDELHVLRLDSRHSVVVTCTDEICFCLGLPVSVLRVQLPEAALYFGM